MCSFNDSVSTVLHRHFYPCADQGCLRRSQETERRGVNATNTNGKVEGLHGYFIAEECRYAMTLLQRSLVRCFRKRHCRSRAISGDCLA